MKEEKSVLKKYLRFINNEPSSLQSVFVIEVIIVLLNI